MGMNWTGQAIRLDAPRSRKLVLITLADRADTVTGGDIAYSIDTVAQLSSCKRSTAQEIIAEFRKLKILLLEEEGGKGPGSTNRYRLDMARAREIYGEIEVVKDWRKRRRAESDDKVPKSGTLEGDPGDPKGVDKGPNEGEKGPLQLDPILKDNTIRDGPGSAAPAPEGAPQPPDPPICAGWRSFRKRFIGRFGEGQTIAFVDTAIVMSDDGAELVLLVQSRFHQERLSGLSAALSEMVDREITIECNTDQPEKSRLPKAAFHDNAVAMRRQSRERDHAA